jgi:hypothetical protein
MLRITRFGSRLRDNLACAVYSNGLSSIHVLCSLNILWKPYKGFHKLTEQGMKWFMIGVGKKI